MIKAFWFALALDRCASVGSLRNPLTCQSYPSQEDVPSNAEEDSYLLQLGLADSQLRVGRASPSVWNSAVALPTTALGANAYPTAATASPWSALEPFDTRQNLASLGLPATAVGANAYPTAAAATPWPALGSFGPQQGKFASLEAQPRPREVDGGRARRAAAPAPPAAAPLRGGARLRLEEENRRLHRENGDILEAMIAALRGANSSLQRQQDLEAEVQRLQGQVRRQAARLRHAEDHTRVASLLEHSVLIPLIPKDKTGIFWVTVTFIVLTCLSMGIFQIYCATHPAVEPDRDFDDANWAQIHAHMESRARTGIMQGREEVRTLILMFGFVTVGFCVLWWMGIMQPLAKQLLLYAYLAVAALMLLSVILAPASGVLHMILGLLVGIVTRIDDVWESTGARARALGRLATAGGRRGGAAAKAQARGGARPAPKADAGRGTCVSM